MPTTVYNTPTTAGAFDRANPGFYDPNLQWTHDVRGNRQQIADPRYARTIQDPTVQYAGQIGIDRRNTPLAQQRIAQSMPHPSMAYQQSRGRAAGNGTPGTATGGVNPLGSPATSIASPAPMPGGVTGGAPGAGITHIGQTGLTSQPGRNPMYAGFHGLGAMPAGGFGPQGPGSTGSGSTGSTGAIGSALTDATRNNVTPGPIYSPQQTTEATNSAVAASQVNANMPWLRAQGTPEGQSVRSPSATARALPDYAGALATGAELTQSLPFAHALANAQHQTAGESGVEGNLLDWLQIDRSVGNVGQQAGIQRFGAILQALQGLIGG